MKYTFRHGIHPEGRKEISKDCPLTDFPTPAVVHIPLSQHIGAPAEPAVAAGDAVKQGTLIGTAKGFVSANVFSSVSGTVKGFENRPNAMGAPVMHVVIENDGKFDKELLPHIAEINADTVKARVKEAGIVGMGGATFPTHVKLSPKTPVDTLIINAAECEPYITCDYRLCLEKAEAVLRGTELLMIALGVTQAYIGIENNKPDAISILSGKAPANIHIIPLVTKYPQGAEKQLIYAITRRKVRAGGLPADIGVVVDNVHTAYAVWDAVVNDEPLYRRAMTVSGLGVKPGNYWVNNGATYQDVFDYSKYDDSENVVVTKVISGGPMMGFAQADLNACTGKGTSSLLFLTDAEFYHDPIDPCINCARCAKHCPMNLMPMFLDRAALNDDVATLKKYGVMNCIECGCCSYICPANRRLVQSMKRGKILVRKEGNK